MLRIEECGHIWTAPWRPGAGDCGHRCTRDDGHAGDHECACDVTAVAS